MMMMMLLLMLLAASVDDKMMKLLIRATHSLRSINELFMEMLCDVLPDARTFYSTDDDMVEPEHALV